MLLPCPLLANLPVYTVVSSGAIQRFRARICKANDCPSYRRTLVGCDTFVRCQVLLWNELVH